MGIWYTEWSHWRWRREQHL